MQSCFYFQVRWKQPDRFDFTSCVPWTEDLSASVSSCYNDNFSWDSGTSGLWKTYAKELFYICNFYKLEKKMARTFWTVIYCLSSKFPLQHKRQNDWGYSFKNSLRSPHSHNKQCSWLQSPGWHCGAPAYRKDILPQANAASTLLDTSRTGRDQWRMVLSIVSSQGSHLISSFPGVWLTTTWRLCLKICSRVLKPWQKCKYEVKSRIISKQGDGDVLNSWKDNAWGCVNNEICYI